MGLPGSGKSTIIEEKYSSSDWLGVHDFLDGAVLCHGQFVYSQHYPRIVQEIVFGTRNIIVADIMFCNKAFYYDGKKIVDWWIGKFNADVIVKTLCFENQPDRCRRNVGIDNEKLKKIDELAPHYSVFDGAEVLPVWSAEPNSK